jgi:hypothetical protein
MKYKIISIVSRLLQPVLSYCQSSPSRGVLCLSDEALATALYADIHALDYAALTSSMQTTLFKSPINGTFLLSFIQHC